MSKIYRLEGHGGYPEGSPLHGTTYAAVWLNGDPGPRLGSLRVHPDGTFSAESDFVSAEEDGFASEVAAVEWMLRRMLDSGRWIADMALIALAKM